MHFGMFMEFGVRAGGSSADAFQDGLGLKFRVPVSRMVNDSYFCHGPLLV